MAGLTFGYIIVGGATRAMREHGEMTLLRFKCIWYTEWGYRQLGRIIGAVYAIGAPIFWYLGYFNKAMKIRGLLGCYLLRSKLKTQPRPAGMDSNEGFISVPQVSHNTLATQFSATAILYSLFFLGALRHLFRHPEISGFPQVRGLNIWGLSAAAMTFTEFIFGALVAGLNVGSIYNSGSIKHDLIENSSTVRWMHRNLAYLTCVVATGTWVATLLVPGGGAGTSKRLRDAAHAILAATIGQSVLGILTLLNHIPVWLGPLHQGGFLVLLSTIFWYTHCLRAFPK
ncbi:hypothetical protein Aperf_G00000130214 [Anoplocephala perfoliata]